MAATLNQRRSVKLRGCTHSHRHTLYRRVWRHGRLWAWWFLYTDLSCERICIWRACCCNWLPTNRESAAPKMLTSEGCSSSFDSAIILTQITHRGQLYGVEPQSLAQDPKGVSFSYISKLHFFSWRLRMYLCNICLHESVRSPFPFPLSVCQAAFNTWISRSLPHAHLLLHTQLISIPLKRERLHSCKLSQDAVHRPVQLWATVTKPQQCFTTSQKSNDAVLQSLELHYNRLVRFYIIFQTV